MGTKMAPTYAHLVMSFLEQKLFKNCEFTFGSSITRQIKNNYFRFLDDIFVIWNSSYGNATVFVELFNHLDPSFKFTHEINTKQLHFLDILLHRTNNRIETDIYRKPTDSQQYLHFSSNHPRHVKRNIPYISAKRIFRIVSNSDTLDQRFTESK